MLYSPHLLSHFTPFPHFHHHHHHHHKVFSFSPISHSFSSSSSSSSLQVRSVNLHPFQDLAEAAEESGPIQLPPSTPIFAVDDNPSALQVTTSVLLTGAISVFLFRSLRRRARRAKELRVRSTGVKTTKDLREEAVESLRAIGVAPVEDGKPPSPVQALLGGIAAGAIAIILYRFATTIEASLNRQTISDNFSVRQITITIRTIINGLCYLATFVFGINSVGLLLYSVQLAFNSLMDRPADISKSDKEGDNQLNETIDPAKSSTYNVDSRKSDMQESSDDT